MTRIIVCVKQMFDPTAPASAFQIDRDRKQALPPEGSPPVLNPYDENALEAALQIKDRNGAHVTVVSMGPKLAKMVLLKTLAAGADELVMLQDPDFEFVDSYATVQILGQAVRKIGAYDLIFCGRQAGDTDSAQVGMGLAELFGIPGITLARKVEVEEGNVRVERESFNGYEVVVGALPAVVTVGSEVGDMRFPALKNLMAAKKKQVPIWTAADLEVSPAELVRTELVDIAMAPARGNRCEMIAAGSPEAAARELAARLRSTGVV